MAAEFQEAWIACFGTLLLVVGNPGKLENVHLNYGYKTKTTTPICFGG
jgi:hypothetical protein